jgi:hypothetical protein
MDMRRILSAETRRKLSIAGERGGKARAAMPDFHDMCVKGGKARAAMPDFTEMCQKGFAAVMEKRPEVLLWLHKKIRRYNKERGIKRGSRAENFQRKRA